MPGRGQQNRPGGSEADREGEENSERRITVMEFCSPALVERQDFSTQG
jgi:hypothetical protein